MSRRTAAALMITRGEGRDLEVFLAERAEELRFFGGLTIEEAAAVLGIGKRTVDREWVAAKAWLLREFSGAEKP